MKPALLVLCLLAGATAASAEPQSHRIREVRFAGDPAFEPDVLKKVFEEGNLAALDADLVRLRSFYLSNGYFDAEVAVRDVTFEGRDATVTLQVRSGPRSRIRHLTIAGGGDGGAQIPTGPNGDFPGGALCQSLLDAQRDAERRGRMDFAVDLEVAEADALPTARAGNWADVRASVREGAPRVVGRISFSGHFRINESTLRRMMALREREVFDAGKLRRSLARLNASGLFEPVTRADVEIRRNDDGWSADLSISVRERRRRRWLLSGPLVPFGLGGSLQAAISSRLPPWGRSIFEAATYYATFSLVGVSNPLGFLTHAPGRNLTPLLVLERPYLPGQALFSGFALSPSLSPRAMLASYSLAHLGRGARAVMSSDSADGAGLVVPVRTNREVAYLICEPPKPRLRWLRAGAAYAADLGLAAVRPY